MIPYEELCAAIDRYRARLNGVEEPPPPAEMEAAAAPAEQYYDDAAAAAPEEGVTLAPIEQDVTNELDIDSLDVVDE